jgi:hypothetical protein
VRTGSFRREVTGILGPRIAGGLLIIIPQHYYNDEGESMKEITGRLDIWFGRTDTGMDYIECVVDDGLTPINLGFILRNFDGKRVKITVEEIE